jgi:hypothetical protein
LRTRTALHPHKGPFQKRLKQIEAGETYGEWYDGP